MVVAGVAGSVTVNHALVMPGSPADDEASVVDLTASNVRVPITYPETAPPSQTPGGVCTQSVVTVDQIFATVGAQGCHVANLPP